MRSIGSILDRNEGIGYGFDVLRPFLATSVVLWHSVALVLGNDDAAHGSVFWFYKFFVLPSFFALSGFLVTGSATRLPVGSFITNRAFRIVPALFVDVVFSALILGPIFTTLSLLEYFKHWEFFTYFLNVVGRIHFLLPGVFLDQNTRFVNGSLWTVPFEIACYVLLTVIIVIRGIRYPLAIVGLVALYYVVGLILPLRSIDGPRAVSYLLDLLYQRNVNNLAGAALVPVFLLGCCAYLLRYRIPFSPLLFTIILAAFVALSWLGDRNLETAVIFQMLVCPLIVYATVFVGTSDIRLPDVFRRNDYSYGIYLYGWPIQQSIIKIGPIGQSPMLNFALTMPLLVAFACLSWHFVEKPVLKLRHNLSFLKRRAQKVKEESEATFATT